MFIKAFFLFGAFARKNYIDFSSILAFIKAQLTAFLLLVYLKIVFLPSSRAPHATNYSYLVYMHRSIIWTQFIESKILIDFTFSKNMYRAIEAVSCDQTNVIGTIHKAVSGMKFLALLPLKAHLKRKRGQYHLKPTPAHVRT